MKSFNRHPIGLNLNINTFYKLYKPFNISFHNLISKRFKSHYETLDIPSTATQKEIKLKFYALSRIHHPDAQNTITKDATMFVKISEAYACLSDPIQRATYDQSNTNNNNNTNNNQPNNNYNRYTSHTTYRQRQTLNPDDFIQFKRKTHSQNIYNYREHEQMHYRDWINQSEELFDKKVKMDKRHRATPFWRVLIVCLVFLIAPDLLL